MSGTEFWLLIVGIISIILFGAVLIGYTFWRFGIHKDDEPEDIKSDRGLGMTICYILMWLLPFLGVSTITASLVLSII